MPKAEVDALLRERLLELLVLRPCHTTGLHTPDDHLRTVCSEMKISVFDRLLAAVGIDEADLRHELHEECCWCHDIPLQEEYRDRLRRTWAWAGVPLTPELAADAPDKPQPEDVELMFAHVPDHWTVWGEVNNCKQIGARRGSVALDALVKSGRCQFRRQQLTAEIRRTP